MDWKDTVMSAEDVFRLANKLWNEMPRFRDGQFGEYYIDVKEAIKEAQAEISFKAGYESGWNDNKPYLPDPNEPWDREQTVFADGKLAGIRKVVEFIRSERKCRYIDDVLYYPVYEEALKTQEIKWGIKEGK